MNKVVQGEELLRIEIGCCLVIFRPFWLVIVVTTVCVVKYLSRFSFFYDVYIHQKSCAPSVGWRKTRDTDNQQLSSLPRFTQLQLNLFLVPFFCKIVLIICQFCLLIMPLDSVVRPKQVIWKSYKCSTVIVHILFLILCGDMV